MEQRGYPLPEQDSVSVPDPPLVPTQALDLGSTIHHLVATVSSQEDTMQGHKKTLSQWGAMMTRHAEMLNEILQTLHSHPASVPAASLTRPAVPPLVPSQALTLHYL